ncbi:uncharacterized protein LOC144158706 isoform X4 [Haemaphysalis longicornis]
MPISCPVLCCDYKGFGLCFVAFAGIAVLQPLLTELPIIRGENTTARTSIPRGTSSMPDGCVMPMPVVTAHTPVVSCSQRTQAAITTMAIGTQCCLGLLTSTSSQTEEEFPDVDNARSGAFGEWTASQDGAGILTKADPHTCSCQPRSRTTDYKMHGNIGVP